MIQTPEPPEPSPPPPPTPPPPPPPTDRVPITRARPQRTEIEIDSNILVPASQTHNDNNMMNEYFNDGYDEMFAEVSENDQGIVNVPPRLKPAAPIVAQPVRQSVIQFAPRIIPQGYIQIAPQIFVPDAPAGISCNWSSDIRMEENQDLEGTGSFILFKDYTTTDNGKRVSTANAASAVRAKKARMDLVQSPGFVEISSSMAQKVTWYFAKNLTNVRNYIDFLRSLKPALSGILKTRVQKHPIKFSLKLEATYNRPNVANSSENRTFKTSAVEVFSESNIDEIAERAYIKLLIEEEAYTSRGSGFTLESIDGLLLAMYKYTPLGGSSYIPLPAYIDRKRGTINPQNVDQQCFKWAVLAKHVMGENKFRIGENYRQHEDKYNFNGISFPTPLSNVQKFKYNNPTVSVNVCGLDKKFQPPRKYPTYEVYPLRVADDEKQNHFDLLLLTDGDNSHYTSQIFQGYFAHKKLNMQIKRYFAKDVLHHLTNRT
ncbi:hypothetical protein QTP88_020928 [Uroleucon formosanum]